MANKNILLNIALILAIIAVIAVALWPVNRGNEYEGITNYTYSGVNNRTFTFKIDSSRETTYHLLTYEYVDGIILKNVSIPFEYSPRDLEEIEVPDNLRKRTISDVKGIFIVSDPRISEKIDLQDKVAQVTISRITGSEELNQKPHIFGIDTFGADLVPIEGTNNTVLTCDNATKTGRIIYLKQGAENKVYYDENNEYCVVLEFKEEKDVVKVATRLVYSLLKVMP